MTMQQNRLTVRNSFVWSRNTPLRKTTYRNSDSRRSVASLALANVATIDGIC